ncbi:hypothetical protein GGI07_000631 [Coemansia sp. Benny D115]|nr:hypothetical protein GGI07_000631 [Coemansia sp. Benny D115]
MNEASSGRGGSERQSESPLPVVMWHGMGDTCCDNSTMGAIQRIVEDELPGVYVHSVKLGTSEGADRNAGFFGNLNEQIDRVCDDLSQVPELQGRRANLLGFSQGGLFLRALLQRCPSIRGHRMVTFGSPHSGVAKIPECAKDSDALCNWMRQLAARGVYSWYIRDHVIQAQYFKDPVRIDQYLKYNIFLPDINGESEDAAARTTYRERLCALDRFVMVRFDEDAMIYPHASSWFGFVDAEGNETDMRGSQMYREDWLGLRQLDEDGRLEFLALPGKHMSIGEDALRRIVAEYFASGDHGEPRRAEMGRLQAAVFRVQGEAAWE